MTILLALDRFSDQSHLSHDDDSADCATANSAHGVFSRYVATFNNAFLGRFSMLNSLGLSIPTGQIFEVSDSSMAQRCLWMGDLLRFWVPTKAT